jgi:hypothetical protein
VLLCIVIRLAIIGLMVSYVPTYWDMMCKAWNLDRTNWWRSSDEPWFNSASTFNSLVCWWLWLIFQVINWLLVFYGTALAIAIPVGLYKKGWFLVRDLGGVLKLLLYWGWIYFKDAVLGRRPDETAIEIAQSVMVIHGSQKEKQSEKKERE